jgi:hypothetical protein
MKIELTEQEIKIILELLSQVQYKISAPLIDKIVKQLKSVENDNG